jgi:hypothetical protein
MFAPGHSIPPAPRIQPQGVLPVRAASILGLVSILGGCSASEIVQNWTAPPTTDLPQSNLRRVIADNIDKMFPNRQSLGDVEISGARLVDHLKGAAWLACLRLDASGNPQHYAIFIQGDKILDWRAGIVIDQCHKQTYSKFEISPPTKKSNPTTEREEGK